MTASKTQKKKTIYSITSNNLTGLQFHCISFGRCSFETGNHIKQQVNGYHKTVFVPRIRDDGTKSADELDSADVIVQSGSFSYIAPDGTLISVNYIADENGFQAFGDALPKSPPPIPETILLLNEENEEQQQHQQTPQFLATSQGGSPH